MDAFDNLKDLEELDLSTNLLNAIPHKALGQLGGLKYLNLGNNSLTVKYGMVSKINFKASKKLFCLLKVSIESRHIGPQLQ